MKNTNKLTYVVPQMQLETFADMDILTASGDDPNTGVLDATTKTSGAGWSIAWSHGDRNA